jgi:hypothetical protein
MAEQLRFRQARPFVAAIGVALLLGGCQIVPDPGAPQTRAEPPPRAPRVEAPAPVQTPAPQPALPREEARNRVAVLVPLSGPNAGIGRSLANAANLALSDSGETRIQITAYDTARGAARLRTGRWRKATACSWVRCSPRMFAMSPRSRADRTCRWSHFQTMSAWPETGSTCSASCRASRSSGW